MTATANLPPIWDLISPLSRDRAQSAMEESCRRTAEHFRFWAPRISHAAAILVLCLSFYSEDLRGMGGDINTFLFPDLSLSASSKAELLSRRWDFILGSGAFASFADTSLLLSK